MRSWQLLLLPVATFAAIAQTSYAAKRATGTVTGHVYCADTNAPARMASVQLEPVKDAEQRTVAHSRFSGNMPAGGVAQTGFDGSFTLSKVPPGSYYVVAEKAGYLSTRANVEDLDTAEPQPAAGQPPIVIPRVDVQADQAASIDIRLERGAAVSGTVRFDDGSPASDVEVMLLHRSKDKWVGSNAPGLLMRVPPNTDDLGHYRISGLRDRDYLVQVMLSRMDMEARGVASMYGVQRSTLRIYSGDTPHISDAVPFKLGAGEERSGEDITIPLSKFHSVSGVVTAASDGHPINSGHLTIEDPTDKESVVDAELGNDGTFHLEGVPEGAYTLRVENARDKQMQEVSVGAQQNLTFTNEKIIHQYDDFEQTIKVEGDIPNLVLTVPETTKRAATASQ
jgi:VCBS repeat-containing protein